MIIINLHELDESMERILGEFRHYLDINDWEGLTDLHAGSMSEPRLCLILEA